MNYLGEYTRKLTSAENAVRVIRSGNWVDYGHFACAPTFLDWYLAKRVDELRDVNFKPLVQCFLCRYLLCDPP
jgi:acyl-CoA hydrolase